MAGGVRVAAVTVWASVWLALTCAGPVATAHAATPHTAVSVSPSPIPGADGDCPLCGLPVPPSRTGPIVAAGTAIVLDSVGIAVAGAAALIRRHRRHRRR